MTDDGCRPGRKCPECGRTHNTVVEDREGNIVRLVEKCYECIMSKCRIVPITEQITLDETDH